MRSTFVVLALLVGPVGFAAAQPADPPIKNLAGGWVLHKQWEGFMGVAIQFHENGTFDYWFYSDAAEMDPPKYPISGKWTWNAGVLQLASDHRLHATPGPVRQHRGESCLLPEYAAKQQDADGVPHNDRLLFRIGNFDAKRPFEKRR